ncbi:AP2/ERF family transcription factor [Inquilinus sp. OTU3971]|uniref:AP2/ERF family transcription factor n=1 Tax=Inquilinus sp. OTU3971 TaxID=3043855 RepID=UPI00313E94A4
MRVSRIDDKAKRMLGWLVQYSVAGLHTRKFFSDRAFGTSARAKAAAEAFAMKDLEEHRQIRSLRSMLVRRKNTPHGIPGVSRYARPQGTTAFWVAYWTQDGVRHQKKYSILRHGEREARELAFATRAEMTAGNLERLTELLKVHAPGRSAAADQSSPRIGSSAPAKGSIGRGVRRHS